MEVHQLKCPNCNANLEIEDDLDTFFCKYCGTKIIIDGQSDATIKAKADIKLAEKDIERQRMKYDFEERQKERDIKKFYLDLLVVLLIGAMMMLVGGYLSNLS